MDVQNVVAPPKQTFLVQKVTTLTNEDLSASPSKAAAKSQKAASLGEPVQEKESTHDHRENGTAGVCFIVLLMLEEVQQGASQMNSEILHSKKAMELRVIPR